MVNENKSSKVVFVNHQGKPITYYIKHEPKNHRDLRVKKHGIQKEMLRNSEDATNSKPIEVLNSRTLR